ncbi:MAG: tetratricopeptide repeat protein [Archangium sp.]|nr:tetratricopeptide repeat protein [Archangium sp.]
MATEPTADVMKPLEDIRREVIESRNMTIKTDNALKTLHAELKVVAQQQADFQKRSWLSTGVAYLGFLALCVGGVVAVSNAKAASSQSEKQRLEAQVSELTTQVEKQKAEAVASMTAEQNAAQVYKLMSTGSGDDRLKGVDALARIDSAKLTPFQKTVLSDRSGSLRKEVGAAMLERGKTAFRKQDWPEAIAQLSRLTSMGAGDEEVNEALFFLGNAYMQTRKFDEAIGPLNRFVESDKKAKSRDFALLLLVQAYDVTGQKDKAVAASREALSSHPGSEYRQQFFLRVQRAAATASVPTVAPAAPVAAPAAAPVPTAPPTGPR